MGMFDWYIPVPDLNCPNCNSPLDDWQGKDAASELFVWKQGFASPVDQLAGDECNIEIEKRLKFRLPKVFDIYTSCENCEGYRIEAKCKTENEIWTKTNELKVEKRKKLPRKWLNQE